MQLLLAMSDGAELQFRRCLPPRSHTVRSLDIAQLRTALAEDSCQLVVLDPDEVAAEFFSRAVSAVAASGAILVIWTAFAPRAMRRLIEASTRCPTEILFRDTEDPHAIRALVLSHLSKASHRRRLTARLVPSFSVLPDEIALAIAALLSGHAAYQDVSELVAATGRTRRTLERRLRSAGFSGAARLIEAGRILRARDALLGSQCSIETAAAAAGCDSSRALRRLCHRYANSSPTSLLRTLTSEQFVDRVTARVLDFDGIAPNL